MSALAPLLRAGLRTGGGLAMGAAAWGAASYIDDKASRGDPSAGMSALRGAVSFGLRAGGIYAGFRGVASSIPGRIGSGATGMLDSMAPWKWPGHAGRGVAAAARSQWKGSFTQGLMGALSPGRKSFGARMGGVARGLDVMGIGTGAFEYGRAVAGAKSFGALGHRLAAIENPIAPFVAAGAAAGAYGAFSAPGRRARESLYFRPQDFQGGVTYGRSSLRSADVVSGQQAVTMKMVTRRRL